ALPGCRRQPARGPRDGRGAPPEAERDSAAEVVHNPSRPDPLGGGPSFPQDAGRNGPSPRVRLAVGEGPGGLREGRRAHPARSERSISKNRTCNRKIDIALPPWPTRVRGPVGLQDQGTNPPSPLCPSRPGVLAARGLLGCCPVP